MNPKTKKRKLNDDEEDAEEFLKRVDPENYYALITSIKETLEEQKKNSGLKLPDDDNDPNKLRLIMDDN